MRLSKYTVVKKWDILDDFFEKEVKGIKFTHYNFTRMICKCGYVSSQLTLDKCPDCGNFEFHNFNEISNYNPVIDKEQYLLLNVASGDKKIEAYDVKLHINLLDSEIDFNITSNLFLELFRDDITFNHSYPSISLSEFIKNNYPYWDDYKDFLTIMDKNFENLIKIIKMSKNNNDFIKDKKIFQYPNLSSLIIKSEPCRFKGGFNELLTNEYGIPSEYFNAIDYNIKNKELDYNNIRNHFYGNFRVSTVLKIIQEETYGFEKIIKHHLCNNLISFKEAYYILNKIDALCSEDDSKMQQAFDYSFKYFIPKKINSWQIDRYKGNIDFKDFFDLEYFDFFEDYFKENIMNKKDKIVESFIEQIKFMLDNNIKINKENLKLKNINWFYNKNVLAIHYKIPEGKVNLFLDMFEVNPLKAINLIKDRKKLSPKEVDTIIEEIMKNEK